MFEQSILISKLHSHKDGKMTFYNMLDSTKTCSTHVQDLYIMFVWHTKQFVAILNINQSKTFQQRTEIEFYDLFAMIKMEIIIHVTAVEMTMNILTSNDLIVGK